MVRARGRARAALRGARRSRAGRSRATSSRGRTPSSARPFGRRRSSASVATTRRTRRSSATRSPPSRCMFFKPPSSIIGPGETVVLRAESEKVEHEGELGVVIGKRASRVSREDALSYVLGYTCVNDVTARDLQKKDGQWSRAKGFDTFCPVGPWIETDLDPSDLSVQVPRRRRGPAGRAHVADDVRRPHAHRVRQPRVHARAGRSDRSPARPRASVRSRRATASPSPSRRSASSRWASLARLTRHAAASRMKTARQRSSSSSRS